jgi:hypothetical protein
MALSCGMIAMIDDAIGRVLERLNACGLADNTVIVFTTDHDDFLGDHGLLLKGPRITKLSHMCRSSGPSQRCALHGVLRPSPVRLTLP